MVVLIHFLSIEEQTEPCVFRYIPDYSQPLLLQMKSFFYAIHCIFFKKKYRKHTCKKLYKNLAAQRAVLWRSPSFSGKTWMSRQYMEYLQSRGEKVFRLSLLRWTDNSGFEEYWKKQVGCTWEEATESSCTIIIDEAQMLYPLTEDHIFWRSVKAIQSKAETDLPSKIVLFSCYGLNPEEKSKFSTPVRFINPFDLAMLYFDRMEYDQLMDCYNTMEDYARMPVRQGTCISA